MNTFERIVECLKDEPQLDGFTYVKSKYAFVKQVKGVRYRLNLRHRFFFNMYLDIKPSYDVRIEILHKWFEKFNFRTIKDQRDSSTMGTAIIPSVFSLPDKYEFDFYGEIGYISMEIDQRTNNNWQGI